jgi:cobalt-zinc-cadmium efflux system membrane fusion protein
VKRLAPLGATLLLAGCQARGKAAEPAPYHLEGDVVVLADPAAESALAVEPVTRVEGDHLSLTGRVVWDEDATVRVFSPVSGRVARIAADLGTSVGPASLLAILASPDFGQAQADTTRAKADLQAAERTLARAHLLYERGATARKDLEQAEAEAARARAEAERTAARLRLWGGLPQVAVVDESFPLKSPVRGRVVERNVNPGQEVRPDASTPLFVISDPSRLWVLLDVTERDLPDILPGAEILIRTPAYSDRSFPGRLDRLSAALDPATRTARARGRVPNPGGLLKAEMYVTVEVIRSSSPRLVLPARAVIQEANRRYVFVEEGPGRYRRVAVSAGPEREGTVTVLSGLEESARVVTQGSLLLEAAWAEGRRP